MNTGHPNDEAHLPWLHVDNVRMFDRIIRRDEMRIINELWRNGDINRPRLPRFERRNHALPVAPIIPNNAMRQPPDINRGGREPQILPNDAMRQPPDNNGGPGLRKPPTIQNDVTRQPPGINRGGREPPILPYE